MTASFLRRFEVLICVGVVIVGFLLLMPALEQGRESARRSQAKNNLKQLGLAISNYQDVFNVFPPGGVFNDEDVAFHGWMTPLLPYLECSPIYNFIDQNLPWGHPANRYLFQTRIAALIYPGSNLTSTSDGLALSQVTANQNVLYRNSSTKVSDIVGGTAHCWVFAEATGNFTPWGDAFNWRDWNGTLCDSPDGLGVIEQKGCHFGLADGSVRFVSREIAPSVLKEFAKSIPTPPPEATRKPVQHYDAVADFPLPAYFKPLEVFYGKGSAPETAVLQYWRVNKFEKPESVSVNDLTLIAKHCPDVTVVDADLTLNEQACKLLAQRKYLQTLVATGVEPTGEVIAILNGMPQLRLLAVRGLPDEQHASLREKLPNLEVIRRQ